MRYSRLSIYVATVLVILLVCAGSARAADGSELDRMIKSLKKGEEWQRAQAVEELGRMGNLRAVPAIIEALKDPSPRVRVVAATTLAYMKDKRAVKPIFTLLKDPSYWVRRSAAEALTTLGWKPSTKKEKVRFLVAFNDWSELMKLGDVAFEPLLEALKSKNEDVRTRAARALGELGDKRAVKPLSAAISDKDSDVRERALASLVKLGPEGFKVVTAALKHKNQWVRYYAAETLGKTRDKRAVEPLKETLKDRDYMVREQAARALSGIGWKPASDEERAQYLMATMKWDKLAGMGDAGLKALSSAVEDVDLYLARAEAAEALGRMGDKRAVRPLLAAMGSRQERVRIAACAAIVKIGAPAVPALVATLNDRSVLVRDSSSGLVQNLAAETLVKIGAPAFAPLASMLKGKDQAGKTWSAWALGELRDKRAVGPLTAALKDKDQMVRASAASALKNLGDPGAVAALADAMKDTSALVRRSAADALAKHGAAAVDPLIAMLKDKDRNVRIPAIRALSKLGDKRVIKPLMTALKDKDEQVRYLAAEALIKTGPDAAEPLMAVLKQGDSSTRILAANALGGLRDMRAIKPLIAAIKDPDGRVRKAVVRALYEMGWEPLTDEQKAYCMAAEDRWHELSRLGKAALEPLVAAVKGTDRDARLTAVGVLGELRDTRAVKPLLEAFKDSDSRTRNTITAALVRIGQPAVKPLAAELQNKDAGVRKAAALALEKLNWKPDNDDRRIRYAMALGRFDLAAKAGPAAYEPLASAMKDPAYLVRSAAAKALAKLGDKRAFESLASALKDNSDTVRTSAAWALGELGDKRAVKPLITALKDPLEPVRWSAAEALGKLGDNSAVEPLKITAGDKHPCVREAAEKALKKLDK